MRKNLAIPCVLAIFMLFLPCLEAKNHDKPPPKVILTPDPNEWQSGADPKVKPYPEKERDVINHNPTPKKAK